MANINEKIIKALSWHDPQEGFYNKITKSAPWRHIVGRVSCAVRSPFHLVTILGLGVEMAAKTIIWPAMYFVPGDDCGPFTWEGIKKDEVIARDTLYRLADSLGGMVVAPERNYRSGIKTIWSDFKMLLGRHQTNKFTMMTAEDFEFHLERARKNPKSGTC